VLCFLELLSAIGHYIRIPLFPQTKAIGPLSGPTNSPLSLLGPGALYNVPAARALGVFVMLHFFYWFFFCTSHKFLVTSVQAQTYREMSR
jgi:hypothetical protein